ncbi:1-acyl-sn-glycerol-3-phosphate acyltransferase [Archangium gephyra]|uniref:1-acyl-sn-glycerol-3-phosphate acyltransferase n=1 Tax=Archangium gephyra TaxID=48 RepID=A0ABX9JNF5_9BACT|nr:lysophospholipid acyltransferase family protein [Archangium gephyra]REG22987.1 1-acyl-sn-glycerol-3-phosphate acyltransferase [Archangium gephyra]
MLRNLLCIVVAVVATAIFFPVTVVVALITLNPGATVWVARRLWSPILIATGGAKVVVTGQENVDPNRPTIYVSNHQSTLDIPIHFVTVPVNFRYVAKHQLKYVPLIGWYLWFAGHIFVNRGRREKAIASLDAAAQKIRGGTSVFLYPEGTRSDDGSVLPFKKGPFALALKSRVPVVPITIEGSGSVMPKNSWNIKPGPVYVKIGKPIDTTGFDEDDREGLARAVRNVIIQQSLELGGKGGDPDKVTAAAGLEGNVSARRNAS